MKRKQADWQKKLVSYVHQKGGRITRQRLEVAQALMEEKGHMGVGALSDVIKKRFPSIGKATLYRTMKLLCDAGIAKACEFGEGFLRYEALHPEEHHDHLICTSCGKIVEFEEKAIEALQEAVAKRFKFEIVSHRLDIFGLCDKCRKLKNKNDTPKE